MQITHHVVNAVTRTALFEGPRFGQRAAHLIDLGVVHVFEGISFLRWGGPGQTIKSIEGRNAFVITSALNVVVAVWIRRRLFAAARPEPLFIGAQAFTRIGTSIGRLIPADVALRYLAFFARRLHAQPIHGQIR